MYGKPGARDDWAKAIEQYQADKREARNARAVLTMAVLGGLFFLPYVISNFPS